MNLVSLLGKALKDDEVIELLADWDAEVIYDFDRLHENTPDRYWASLRELGVELRFDERQKLVTAFCYIEGRDGFSPASPEHVGAPIYASFAQAKAACERERLEHSTSPHTEQWLKILGSTHHVHYEFMDDRLSLVTITLPSD